MGQRLKQGSAVIATAFVLAFMGLISLSEARNFVPWPADLLQVCLVSALCGMLLALSSERAAWLMGAASVLGVLIFAGFWTYSTWALVGEYFPLLDLVLSNLIFLYLMPRGVILFVASILAGLLGVVGVQVLLPDRYRPYN